MALLLGMRKKLSLRRHRKTASWPSVLVIACRVVGTCPLGIPSGEVDSGTSGLVAAATEVVPKLLVGFPTWVGEVGAANYHVLCVHWN